MHPFLEGLTVAVLCGDAREKILARGLADLGARVQVVGLPLEEGNIVKCHSLGEGLTGVDAVILPVPGLNDKGEIFSAYLQPPMRLTMDSLSGVRPGTPLLVGTARPVLRELAEQCKLRLVEIMKLDEIAILNSIPSAEGAIQMAMEAMPITIHGSKSLVIGFGRTAMTLARMLAALGSFTTVAARNPAQRARAFEMGMQAVDFSQLPRCLKDADMIFNTVPSLVLDISILEYVPKDAFILDLASAPGGTDFRAAESKGIKAVLAPGLPGKVAPKTAGRILADVVPRLLMEVLSQE